MTDLDKQFDAVVEKSPNKGGWLPVTAALLKRIGKQAGEQMTVVLVERLDGKPT